MNIFSLFTLHISHPISTVRYVQELVKMKDTFIDPLLHPYSNHAAAASTATIDYDYYHAESPFESADDLPPIAARFMSPTPSMNPPHSTMSNRTPNIDGESAETDEDDEPYDRHGRSYDKSRRPRASRDTHARSPYRPTATRTSNRPTAGAVPFPSRSHASLPPPGRNLLSASTHSLGRQSTIIEQERERERDRERKYSQGQDSPNKGMLRRFRKSQASPGDILGNGISPHLLPEDLRICLEVIDGGVFEGHRRLSEALKKRYDDQYPLVRSLADVFVSNVSTFTLVYERKCLIISSVGHFQRLCDICITSGTCSRTSGRRSFQRVNEETEEARCGRLAKSLQSSSPIGRQCRREGRNGTGNHAF